MYPKKSKDLIPDYAKQIGIPQEHVELIVNSYYKELRTKASNMEHWNFVVRGIGCLRACYNKISKTFYTLLAIKTEYKDDRKSYEYINASRQADILKGAMKMMRKEWAKEKAIRNRRIIHRNKLKDNESKGETKTGMGEQGSDS